MEGKQEGKYQVIISEDAEIRFYEIVEYLIDNYPLERAEKIADELYEKAASLSLHPERGRREERLINRPFDYRYILYKRTSKSMIKVLYYLDKKQGEVYVTDFFPTEKDDREISQRNQ